MTFTYLGQFLANERKKQKISQFTLAKKSNLSMSTIQHIEYGIGTMNITIKTLIRLSIALNISFLKFVIDSQLLKDYTDEIHESFLHIDLQDMPNDAFNESTALSNESTQKLLSKSTSCPSDIPLPINP